MKKLTAGIFTVLIGLCAANSADAAIASKAWVEQDFVKGETYATDKAGLETAISNAKSGAEATAASALSVAQSALDTKITNEETARKAADKDIADFVGALPDGATATTIVGYITEKTSGIATDAALGELQAAVNTNTTNISTNTSAIETLNGSGEGSVAKTIADYVTGLDLANVYGAKTAVEANASAIADIESSAYATSGITSDRVSTYDGYAAQISAKEASANKVSSTADAERVGTDTAFPTVSLVNSLISTANNTLGASVQDNALRISEEVQRATAAEGAINTKIGEVAEGKNVVTMISDGDAATLVSAKGYTDTELDKLETSLSGTSTNLTELTTRVDTAEGKITGLETSLAEGGDTANAIKANADAIQGINDSDVMKSGIDAEKVAAIAVNTAEIAKNAKAIADNAKAAADAAAANAESIATNSTNIATNSANIAANTKKFENYTETKDLSILATNNIPTECSNNANKCVLTYGTTATGNIGFEWEVVERETDGE